jgi:S1-C subfamily serine protease
MVAGFLGCLAYSYTIRSGRGLLSNAAGNPKTDKPIVQTAVSVQQPPVPSAFLGVEIMSVNAVIAEQFDLENPCGVLVNGVVDNSPAQKAGLQRSDVIVSLNSIAVEDTAGFRNIMASLRPGDDVRITYIRDRRKNTTYATLTASFFVRNVIKETSGSDLGISITQLNSDLRKSLLIPADIDGIVVLSVTPGGSADEAGLKASDVITAINNTPVTDMSGFFDALTADKDGTALLDVYSNGRLRYIALDASSVAAAIEQTKPTLMQRILSIFTDDKNIILTEHINEEGDYEKPVCKRLEESGERYDR